MKLLAWPHQDITLHNSLARIARAEWRMDMELWA